MFLLNCPGGENGPGGNPSPNPRAPSSGGPSSPRFSVSSCSDLEINMCGALVTINGEERYCHKQGNNCVVATQCSEINDGSVCTSVSNDYVAQKKCGRRNGACVEVYDCRKFSTPTDCKGDALTVGGGNCVWSHRNNSCQAKIIPSNFYNVHTLYSGHGTVCAETFDDIICWGDDTGKKYSNGLPAKKIEKLLFGSDFGCAEVETKPPTNYMANDGEYALSCFGAKPGINAATGTAIERDSMQINDQAVCAMVKSGTKNKIKCFGNFTATVENPTSANRLKLNAGNQEIERSLPPSPIIITEFVNFALGSDFICAQYANPLGVLNPDLLACSGKINFNVPDQRQNPAKSLSLVAADKFACYLEDAAGLDKDKAKCYEKKTGPVTAAIFMFTGAQVSPRKFTSIFTGPNYLCGITTAPKAFECYPHPGGALPGPQPPGVTFNMQKNKFALGSDYQCGVTTANKVKCWGTNAAVNAVPNLIKD